MAISKNSVRIQFTLNADKEKEKAIINFLNSCVNPNNTIKEILYNIVNNGDSKLLTVTHLEVTKSDTQLLKESESHSLSENIVTKSKDKSVEVSNLELNEMEELKKFM